MALRLSGGPLLDSDVVEIRVHGVSNTPPQSMLGVDVGDIRLIAGDEVTGIYAPVHESAADHLVRAYSWGQLTSGQRLKKDLFRGLWMLLLPFAFANVALWAQPTIKGEHSNAKSETTGTTSAVCRLLSLSLTVTMVLGVLGVSLNLAAWQWSTHDDVGGAPWLNFLRDGWWSIGTRPIALGTAVAMGVMVLLWYVAHRSFSYEAEVSAMQVTDEDWLEPDDSHPHDHPMESRWFWRGNAQARNLSSLHLTVALAVPAVFGVMPVLFADNHSDKGGWTVVGWVLVVWMAALSVVACALVVSPSVSSRMASIRHAKGPLLAQALAALGAIASLIFLAFTPLEPSTGRTLPGFSGFIGWLATGQWLLILGLGLVAGAQHVSQGGSGRDAVAWWGMGSALMMTCGWLLALLYTSALMYYSADYLNGKGNPTGQDDTIALPLALQWAPFGVVIGLLIVVGVAVGALFPVYRKSRRESEVQQVLDEYPGRQTRHAQARAHTVAARRAYREFLQERLLGVCGLLVLLIQAMVLVLVCLTVFQVPVDDTLATVAGIGARILLLLGIALAAVAVSAYRDGAIRRIVGIVWDIATFWPRAGHPWAPPCYAERSVAQLATLIANRKPGPGFILAGHSQGSVICAATILQLPASHRRRTYFVSFGTQLRKFYGRAFPAMFAPARLRYLAETLHSPSTVDGVQRDELRWRSFWRETDPIGYRVYVTLPCKLSEAGPHTVDHNGHGTPTPFVDPTGLVPVEDELLDPPMRGHSNYMADPNFTDLTAQASAILRNT